MRSAFGVPIGALSLGLIGVGTGYSLSGLAAGTLTKRFGIGGLLTLSCLLVSVAMLGLALADRWQWLLVWPVVWGLGSGGIDAALNHYASEHFPPRHMNWLHACYSLGAAIGPIQMTVALVWLSSWRLGYAFVSAAMFGMMLAFFFTRARWNDPASQPHPHIKPIAPSDSNKQVTLFSALATRAVWWHAALFFLYTGLESLLGQWSFSLLTQARGTSQAVAGMWVGGYFAAIALGRVLAGVMTQRYGVPRWLHGSLWLLLLAAALLQLGVGGTLGGLTLALLGLSMAPVFPCLMLQTPVRLGRELSRHTIGIQVAAATIGAAGLPSLVGILIPVFGLETISRASLILAVLLVLLNNWRGQFVEFNGGAVSLDSQGCQPRENIPTMNRESRSDGIGLA